MITLRLMGLVLLVGCGEAPAADTTLVISSDPELRAMAAELLPGLASRSGLELREPVRLERRSRAQLEAYLQARLDEEVSEEEAGHIQESYGLLGLFPGELDLRDLLLDVYGEQVAGFYDPDSAALFVLDDQPAEALRPLLVHELVHAVQDQAADLDALTDRERGNDRQTAAQAAIEGHATLVMLEYMTEQMQGQPVDFSTLPDFGQALRPALEAMSGQFPALAGAPAVLRESLLFPYLEGASFVQAVWTSADGRPAPLGPFLPASTEQVIDPSRLLGPTRDAPTDVTVRLSGGPPSVYTNSLGRLETGVLLDELVGSGAADGADGWDGDAYVLAGDEAGERGLVWVSVWDDTEARNRFMARLRSGPGTAAWRVEDADVDGRPVVVVRIGDAVSGAEVDIGLSDALEER